MSIKQYIPNAITCSNLLSGCFATYCAFAGDARMALWWMIIGAAFDFFDGMSARLLKVSSPIGRELDSLADDITFGLAPSTIVFSELSVLSWPSALQGLSQWLPFLAFIMAAFSALRLAKFNIDVRQTSSFIGLPTPANALFWASLIVFNPSWMERYSWSPVLIVAMVLFSSWLLVSEIPMFALKFKQWGWKGNEVRYLFIALAVVCILLFGLLKAWWIVILAYIAISLYLWISSSGSQVKRL